MAKFKYPENQAAFFIPVDLRSQILPDSFEWALSYLIDHSDLSSFDANYHNDTKGAAAFPPAVLLKIILFSYSHGVIGSRRIEAFACDNMTCKALAENMEPDHSTIASFISSNQKPMMSVFIAVLLQCAELGLIQGDLFAIDGCKLPSNASKEWSGTLEDFKKKKAGWEKLLAKLLAQQKSDDSDAAATKNQLNPTCKSYVEDKELEKRHIKRVTKKLAKLTNFLATHSEDKKGADGNPIQSNVTDEESAKIKGPHGVIQGFNGIAIADSKNQVIVAADAFGSGPEAGTLPTMLDTLNETMKEITGKEEPLKTALVTGDTGYFSEENLQAAQERGIDVLIPDQQFRKRDDQFAEQKDHDHEEHFSIEDFTHNEADDTYTCPEGKTLTRKPDTTIRGKPMQKWQASVSDCKTCPMKDKCMKRRGNKRGSKKTLLLLDHQGKENLSEKMREKIDNPVYRNLYGQRMRIIEPCFSDITYCKGLNRFTLRGKVKVGIQWLLYCLEHNIGKCIEPLGALCPS
jgi:transposase